MLRVYCRHIWTISTKFFLIQKNIYKNFKNALNETQRTSLVPVKKPFLTAMVVTLLVTLFDTTTVR